MSTCSHPSYRKRAHAARSPALLQTILLEVIANAALLTGRRSWARDEDLVDTFARRLTGQARTSEMKKAAWRTCIKYCTQLVHVQSSLCVHFFLHRCVPLTLSYATRHISARSLPHLVHCVHQACPIILPTRCISPSLTLFIRFLSSPLDLSVHSFTTSFSLPLISEVVVCLCRHNGRGSRAMAKHHVVSSPLRRKLQTRLSVCHVHFMTNM